MLTETQFKVLMILFDDKGHAGWELAEALGMEESNLNPLLKRLEKKNFIFQGSPRKSDRPKKPKGYKRSNNVLEPMGLKKRDGDYKEFPYFLKKEIKILGLLIREMTAINKVHDIGFPFKFIRLSKYMRSMREIFKEDFNKVINGNFPTYQYLRTESQTMLNQIMDLAEVCIIDPSRSDFNHLDSQRSENRKIASESNDVGLKSKEPILLTFKEEMPPTKERRVSKKLLKELEAWWLKYDLLRCLNQDPMNLDEAKEIIDIISRDYLIGEDIKDAICKAVNRLPEYQRSQFPYQEILS
jgi:hypothetical protein